jgi:hypothetical protein
VFFEKRLEVIENAGVDFSERRKKRQADESKGDRA